MRDKVGRLHFQTLAPPIIALLAFVLTAFYFGVVLSERFKTLQESLSESENATRSLLTISNIRGDLRERLLLYRHTIDTKYLGEINDLDLERSLQTARFEQSARRVGAPESLIEGFVSGARITKNIEYSLIDAIASGNDKRASRLFEDYSDLFDINGARLKDLHAFVQAKLSTSENEIHRLLSQLPIHLLAILLIGTIGALYMTRFYRQRVLGPLTTLHRGLRQVSTGDFEQNLQIPDSATEIKEMLRDFNDMTIKLKQITGELTHAREEAMHAANIKSEFLANMSHEIRTPLNVIIGLSNLIFERDLDPKTKSEVNVLRKSGNMLLNIVNDILDYSKFESGNMAAAHRVFNLHQTIHNVAAMVEPLGQAKDLNIVTQISLEVPKQVYGDPQLFEQALLNLANNAVKFTSQGGVTIQARVLREESSMRLELAVSDTGIGIPNDKIEKLFLRFEQGDKSITRTYGGTGLGLAIVKQIVNLLSGEIKVSSIVGKGTTFTFTLPLEPAEGGLEAVNHTADESAPVFAKPPTILLADDSEDNRFVVQHFLEPIGAQIHEAENGEAAINVFKDNHFDVVLMDIQMPKVDGYEATREIRNIERKMRRPHTPIVALTACALKEDVKRSFEQGFDAHVTKPINKEELVRLLVRLLWQLVAPKNEQSGGPI